MAMCDIDVTFVGPEPEHRGMHGGSVSACAGKFKHSALVESHPSKQDALMYVICQAAMEYLADKLITKEPA